MLRFDNYEIMTPALSPVNFKSISKDLTDKLAESERSFMMMLATMFSAAPTYDQSVERRAGVGDR